MRINEQSRWDMDMDRYELGYEIHALDMAHKRAKRELRKQQLNELVEDKCKLINDVSTLELKLTCLEQENKTLRKEQTNKEKEVQERIIKSMNVTIIDLREQLAETEEKYNELLKQKY